VDGAGPAVVEGSGDYGGYFVGFQIQRPRQNLLADNDADRRSKDCEEILANSNSDHSTWKASYLRAMAWAAPGDDGYCPIDSIDH
jgi:hypothetical protein